MGKRMTKITAVLFGGFLTLAVAVVYAQPELADPTRPSGWRAVQEQGERVSEVPVRLDSILLSPWRRIAVINGHTLAEGESRDGLTLVKVSKSEVEVRVDGQTQRLQLESAAGVRR